MTLLEAINEFNKYWDLTFPDQEPRFIHFVKWVKYNEWKFEKGQDE